LIFYRKRTNLTLVDIEQELLKEDNDLFDDSDADPDYRDSDASGESSEEEEEEEEEGFCTSTPAVTGWRSRQRPKDQVMVYVDPPAERADGDTDVDSGNF